MQEYERLEKQRKGQISLLEQVGIDLSPQQCVRDIRVPRSKRPEGAASAPRKPRTMGISGVQERRKNKQEQVFASALVSPCASRPVVALWPLNMHFA